MLVQTLLNNSIHRCQIFRATLNFRRGFYDRLKRTVLLAMLIQALLDRFDLDV